jgi:hypothetical protein
MSSTLLYLASGKYRSVYENLLYEKVIIVDRSLRRNDRVPAGSKVTLIPGDALPAIRKLKEDKDLKINCLVSVNEGLYGGGGDYPIFSDFLLGYLSPLLADELLVITDIEYYQAAQIARKVARMDWGFNKILIDSNHPRHIDPRIFTTYGEEGRLNYGDVFLLTRTNKWNLIPLNEKLTVELLHGSIWEHEQSLDLLGINLRPRENENARYPITRFFLDHDKVYNIYGRSIEEILAYAEDKKVEYLGLTPWMNHEYRHVIEVLRNYQPKYLKKISFFHLRTNDFQMLYNLVNP